MKTPDPRLRGNKDIAAILLIVTVVSVITGFLLDHLHTRHLLFAAARERSMVAYEVRQLKEEGRHLRLEERIREASVQRDEAPKSYRYAPLERTLRVMLPEQPEHDNAADVDIDAPTDAEDTP